MINLYREGIFILDVFIGYDVDIKNSVHFIAGIHIFLSQQDSYSSRQASLTALLL